MTDYKNVDTSPKPDFANMFCEACGLVASIVLIVLITAWAAS
jgi:hypothetical protein